MKRLTFITAAFAFIILIAGCGQSGPLYVPGNPSTMAIPATNDANVDDEQDEQQDDETPEQE